MKFKRIRTNPVFFLASAGLILALNLYPLITLIRSSTTGRTYAKIHNNVQDFYFYQALMNQGKAGNFLIYDPYTTEDTSSSIIFSYFTLAGKLSSILGLSFADSYHIWRLAAAVLFFIAAYRLIRRLNIPYLHLAWLFFLFAAPLFKDDTPFMYWWTGMDPLRRAAYLPHHMSGAFLMIVSVILLITFRSSPRLLLLFSAVILSALIAFIHTPSLMIILITLPPSVLLYILLNFKKIPHKSWVKTYLPLLAYWVISLLFMVFMVIQSNRGFPWSQYILWERTLQYPLGNELPGALGILFPFALIGAAVSLFSRRFSRIYLAVWFVLPFLLIPLAGKFGLSNIRLIQGAPYLTQAILAVIGFDFLIKYFFSRLHTHAGKAFLFLFLLLFFAHSYRGVAWSIKDQIREYSPIYGNVYLDDRLHGAFDFINDNFPPGTKTISTFYSGNYLPVYTRTISLIGHSGYTYNLSAKEPQVQKFFENKMTAGEAGKFLMDNKITLIFQGPEEKPLYKDYLYPDILKPVYDKEETTIYELK